MMVFYDRIYGSFDIINPEIEKILKHKLLRRLRLVSLSSIPPFCLPLCHCADRMEHSIGVFFLSSYLNIVHRKLGINLPIASLIHDIGTPPFAHISEHFMKDIIGLSHENYVKRLLEDEKVLKKQLANAGTNLDDVVSLVTGTNKLCNPLHSTVDLDNIDNTFRYGLSTGIIFTGGKKGSLTKFNPLKMIGNAECRKHQIIFKDEDVRDWQIIRRYVYEKWIYQPVNLAIGSMIFRVLELAHQANKLVESFFLLNDFTAFEFLLGLNIDDCSILLNKMLTYDYYKELYRMILSKDVANNKINIPDFDIRVNLAKAICDKFNLKPSKIAVFAGYTNTYKTPLEENAKQNVYLICVYADPGVKVANFIMKDFVEEYYHNL